MQPWYKVCQPRREVREGRSFNPDEFAIALEQVVSGVAPDDYRNATKFFDRTHFTSALTEHTQMVLKRLSGRTANTAPVLTLVTQFGGGKTHTLTALYHLVKSPARSAKATHVRRVLDGIALTAPPKAKVGVFVGNAWDKQPGAEWPWIDLARQLAGPKGVEALGPEALKRPPGTDAIAKLMKAAGGTVLFLFDEVLNYVNRYREDADAFYSFVHNLTVAIKGESSSAAVISLPRSQVEMTDFDAEWQARITKVVRRVAKDLISNDEAEITEVIRARLFDDLGTQRVRDGVASAYADWCFERRNQLPPEWTSVDSGQTARKVKEHLAARFGACYPFHPATISVFQRKWQTISSYQQTRGTLAMLAQWLAGAFREGYQKARREPLLTLGSAPLDMQEFAATVLGQLNEPRLLPAIETDIAGQTSHARALDADTKGALRDIHRRVATVILFESSGGMTDQYAHLPELRFALGEPEIDTTSIDNATAALAERAFYFRRAGTDGYRFGFKPTLRKVVSDRRASLDPDDVPKKVRKFVEEEFRKDPELPLLFFPEDGSEVNDEARLRIVVVDPGIGWDGDEQLKRELTEWTAKHGKDTRRYPAGLVWCVRGPGTELQDRVEWYLAWKKVQDEIRDGSLGGEFDAKEKNAVKADVEEAEELAREEVWATYRYVLLTSPDKRDELTVVDIGSGHASTGASLTARIEQALKSEGYLNESVGASYLTRKWPKALRDSGEWPLDGLRQSFLDGSLTRLKEPEHILRDKIGEYVVSGSLGLAAGRRSDGTYEQVWFDGEVDPADIVFDSDVFLLRKEKAEALTKGSEPETQITLPPEDEGDGDTDDTGSGDGGADDTQPEVATVRLSGEVPSEVWNKIGINLLTKLKRGEDLVARIELSAKFPGEDAQRLRLELEQALQDLAISGVRVE